MIGWHNTRKALSDLESLLTCKICKCLVSDPCSLEACDHFFCRKCVESQVGVDSKCPECGAFSWLKDLKTNRQLANTVASCETLRSLVGHLQTEPSSTVKKQRNSKDQKSQHVDGKEIPWEETQQSASLGTDSFVFPSPTEQSNPVEAELTSLQETRSLSKQEHISISKSEFDFEDLTFSNNSKIFQPPIKTYSLKDRKNARKFTLNKSSQMERCLNNEDKKEKPGVQSFSEVTIKDLDSNDIQSISVREKRCLTKKDTKCKNKEKESQMKITSFSTNNLNKKKKYIETSSTQSQCFTKSCEKRQLRRSRNSNKELPLDFTAACTFGITEEEPELRTNKNYQQEKFTKLVSSQLAETVDLTGSKEDKENLDVTPRRRKRKSVETIQLPDTCRSTAGKVKDSLPVKDKRRSSIETKSSKVLLPLNKRNKKGETPLHVAALKGEVEMVRTLLKEGADPNTKDNAGWTPLHEACNHGFVGVAELLLDAGAMIDVAGGFDHDTPLHDAVANGRTELAKLLVSRGAPLDVRNKPGLLPKDYAVTDEMMAVLTTHLYSPSQVKTRSGHVATTSTTSSTSLNTAKEKVILATGLSIEQKQKLEKCLSVAGGIMVNEFTDSVTHIVAAINKDGACPRTMKYLNGVLTGKWIVNFDWVIRSIRSKYWVDEGPFEVRGTNDASVDAPRKARTNASKQLPGLFDGCNFYLFGEFIPPTPSRDVLSLIIKRGGGKILTREPKPDVSDVCMLYSSPGPSAAPVSSPSTVVYHARPNSSQYTCTQYVLYDSSTGKKPRVPHTLSVCSAPVSWLMDCISHFEILDVPLQT